MGLVWRLRTIKEILAHIAFALTVIGFFIMTVHKLQYSSFFLNNTEGQNKWANIKEDVGHALEQELPIPPGPN